MSENGSCGADSANCKILSLLSFCLRFLSMGAEKFIQFGFFAFGQVVMMMMMMMSKVTNRTDDIMG
jgi:hypothetical protein